MRFMFYGGHGSLCYFNYIGETDLSECTIYLFDSCAELSQNRWRDNGYHLFSFTDALQHIECLGYFKNGPERTGIHAFTAINTFILINMLYTVFIFADRFDRTRFLAGNGNIDDCVIRAAFVADAATDAGIMVDPCLAGVGMYMYGSFGTIVLATAGGTSPA